MLSKKKQIRENFRSAVFLRDNFTCQCCGSKGILDAHHICDRHEMPNGGYVEENGISLCPDCHKKAEEYHISSGTQYFPGFHPDDLYRKIGSSLEIATAASYKLGDKNV